MEVQCRLGHFRAAHEPEVLAEARELARANIRHINVPMGCHPSLDDIRRFVEAIAEERAAGRRVLLHCKDGEGRAVCCAAIYRIEFEGWTPQAAFQAASRLPPGLRFVTLLFPSAGLMSRRNLKRPLILGYRRMGYTTPEN